MLTVPFVPSGRGSGNGRATGRVGLGDVPAAALGNRHMFRSDPRGARQQCVYEPKPAARH